MKIVMHDLETTTQETTLKSNMMPYKMGKSWIKNCLNHLPSQDWVKPFAPPPPPFKGWKPLVPTLSMDQTSSYDIKTTLKCCAPPPPFSMAKSIL